MLSLGSALSCNSPHLARLARVCREVVLLSLLLCLSLAPVAAQEARVDTELSVQTVNIDESVLLNVRAIAIDAELDASALNENFDVVTRSSSRQVSILNGQRTSLVEWVLELLPKKEGVLDVPAVTVGAYTSNAHVLTVQPAAQGADRALFLDAFVDQTQPYVQSQVIYTLRVYQDVTVLDGSLSLPEAPLVNVTQLGGDQRFEQTVDGRRYTVLERRYALFAQQSGAVEIPPVVLQASVAQDANRVPNTRTRTRRLTRRSPAITLDVKPRPDDYNSVWWLPSQQVVIEDSWSQPLDSVEMDQPLTRSISLRALGVGEAQLPEIVVPEIDGLSIYADEPLSASSATENGIISEQKSSWAVIAQRAGEITLPELKVDWFNLATGKAEVAVLPARTIVVNAAAVEPTPASTNTLASDAASGIDDNASVAPENPVNQTNDATAGNLEQTNTGNVALEQGTANSESARVGNGAKSSDQLSQSTGRWRTSTMLLLLIWPLSLLLLWLWHRRALRQQQKPAGNGQSDLSANELWQRRAGSPAALAAVKSACETGKVSKIARAVINWGAMVWPESPPTQLLSVAEKLGDATVRSKLTELDALLYRATSVSNPNTDFLQDLPELLQQAVKSTSGAKNKVPASTELPSL